MRQLDSALAGGELSANEYRKRRDEILAAASSAQPPSPVLGPPGELPLADEPDHTSSLNAAHSDTPDTPDLAEVTQVVNVEGAGETEADVTQIITDPTKPPDRGNGTSTTNGAGGDNGVERTQVVQPVTGEPASPAMQQPWATLPPTHQSQTNVGTFPPVPPQVGGPAVTPLDAQDLFTSNKPARTGPKPWVIAVVVVVVLAVAGGAVWFFGFRDSGGNDTAGQKTTQNSAPGTGSQPEPVDITKIELPGDPASNTGDMDITRASQLAVIAPSEATLLADAGVKQLTYSGYSEQNYRYLLYAYKSDSAGAARDLTGKVLDVQKQLGFTDTRLDGVPKGVTVTTVSNKDAAAVRGVYTYGDVTIQLSVLQVPLGEANDLGAHFQQAITAVTDAAPPGK
ncbi:MAG: hypothetical protein ACJ73U_09145 [Actinophytocola sp.]